jgi:hypothetical protein
MENRYTEVDLRPLRVSPPFRRVALCGVDVLERNGEVDEEEIEIVNSPEFELVASHLGYVLRRVEGVPELDIDGGLDYGQFSTTYIYLLWR